MQLSFKNNVKFWIKPIPYHWQRQLTAFLLVVTAFVFAVPVAFKAVVYFSFALRTLTWGVAAFVTTKYQSTSFVDVFYWQDSWQRGDWELALLKLSL